MPSDPFRLRVLKAITAQIQTITPANGYEHDLLDFTDADGRTATRVKRGRDQFGDSDVLPLVVILEEPKPLEQSFPGHDGHTRAGEWTLLIQGFVKDDPVNPTDPAHYLAAEVIKALVKSKLRYNILGLGNTLPCVTDLQIGSPVVRSADGIISDVAFFFLGVKLNLSEDLENPFA